MNRKKKLFTTVFFEGDKMTYLMNDRQTTINMYITIRVQISLDY